MSIALTQAVIELRSQIEKQSVQIATISRAFVELREKVGVQAAEIDSLRAAVGMAAIVAKAPRKEPV